MQLNVSTDYAVRIVLFLAQQNMKNSAEISKAMKIPSNYVVPVAKRLAEAGIIKINKGRYGGYYLARPTWDINLLEIINAMEGTTRINRCLEADHYCSRNSCDTCPVRKSYVQLQSQLDDTLGSITIESLLRS